MDSFPEIEIAEYKVFDESNNNNDDNVLTFLMVLMKTILMVWGYQLLQLY